MELRDFVAYEAHLFDQSSADITAYMRRLMERAHLLLKWQSIGDKKR